MDWKRGRKIVWHILIPDTKLDTYVHTSTGYQLLLFNRNKRLHEFPQLLCTLFQQKQPICFRLFQYILLNNFYLIDLTFQVQILHFPRLFLAFIGHQKFKILFRSSNLYKNYTCLHLKVNLNFLLFPSIFLCATHFWMGAKKDKKGQSLYLRQI